MTLSHDKFGENSNNFRYLFGSLKYFYRGLGSMGCENKGDDKRRIQRSA